MPADNTAKIFDQESRKFYRLSPKAAVTPRTNADGEREGAFVKHGDSGRVFRFGPEEYFLLSSLGDTTAMADVADGFRETFGKSVRPDIVDAFARQMVSAGILTLADAPGQAGLGDGSDEEEDKDEEALSDFSGAGEDIDREASELESMVFGRRGGADRPTFSPRKRKAGGGDASAIETPRFKPGPRALKPSTPATDEAAPADDAELGQGAEPDTQAASDTPQPAAPETVPASVASAEVEDAADALDAAEEQRPADADPVEPPQSEEPASDARPEDTDPAPEQPRPRFSGRRADAPPEAPDSAAPKPGNAETSKPRFATADPEIAERKVEFRRNTGTGDAPAAPGMMRLFDPTGLFKTLNALFGWWGPVAWLLYPLVGFAILSVLNRLTEFGLGVVLGFSTFTRFGVMLVGLLIVNSFVQIVTGVVAHRRGARTPNAGISTVLFVLPRLNIDITDALRLDKADRLAIYAAPIKARLFLFAVATVAWSASRQSSTMLPDIAIVIEQLSLITFLLLAFPLLQGEGYRWMTTYFDQPFLRQRAFNYVFGTSRELAEKLPEPTENEKWAFGLYGVASALFTGILLSLLVIHVTTALEGRFGGTGLMMFAALIGLMLVWIGVMKRRGFEGHKAAIKSVMADKLAEQMMDRRRAGATGDTVEAGSTALVPVSGRSTALQAKGTAVGMPGTGAANRAKPLSGVYAANSRRNRRNRWMVRMAMVAALTASSYIAFLPYPYQVNGNFAILPDARTQVNARIEGELQEIFIDEGDVVEKGQLLARLSDWQPRHLVATAEAELAKARAALLKLEAGATFEDIEVARQKVAAAQADIPFKQAQAERAQTLLERGAIPEAEAERLQSAYLSAVELLRTAEATLAAVEAPASENDIAIARAEIARLEAQSDYAHEALEAVNIYAPVTGRVVTENVGLTLGRHLEAGAEFIEIENHEIARAEVRVSETDISLVDPGDQVVLKAWASSAEERVGTVIGIAPLAEDEELGKVVRVKTEFPNPEGFYRPGMTGSAKIDGEEMPVWRAFTRLFDRFFRIEVWSWIP